MRAKGNQGTIKDSLMVKQSTKLRDFLMGLRIARIFKGSRGTLKTTDHVKGHLFRFLEEIEIALRKQAHPLQHLENRIEGEF